jgi:hypothetical protein
MPVIRDIHLRQEIKEVLRLEGIRQRSKLRPQVATLLHELLSNITNDHLLEPVLAYEFYIITGVSRDSLYLEGNAVLHGSLLSSVRE